MKRITFALIVALTSGSFVGCASMGQQRNLPPPQKVLSRVQTVKSVAGTDRQGNPTLDPEAPPHAADEASDERTAEAKSLMVMLEIVNDIHDLYYQPIDTAQCMVKILQGGVSACTDQYSFYLDPSQRKDEVAGFDKGKFGGIGATLNLEKGSGVRITDILPGSPSAQAKLAPGDVVVAISTDGAHWPDLKEMTLRSIVDMVRGPEGTKVYLSVMRHGKKSQVVLTRAFITIPFVRAAKMIRPKVGYVKVTAFGGDVAPQFFAAVQKLRDSGARSLIIDLRNNGGGKVDAALSMCSWFAPGKLHATILFAKGLSGPYEDLSVVSPRVGVFRDEHVVVLINGGSASASEIFSGYLKYVVHAVIVGQKSFGKGIMQSLLPLSNGGELHLTTAEWFVGPKMIKVHHIGISPTVPVENPKVVKSAKDDLQLQRAIQEAQKLLK